MPESAKKRSLAARFGSFFFVRRPHAEGDVNNGRLAGQTNKTWKRLADIRPAPNIFLRAASNNHPQKIHTMAERFSKNVSNVNKEESAVRATGIVRRIDELGRVVIPKEIRRTLRIREDDPLLTTVEDMDVSTVLACSAI